MLYDNSKENYAIRAILEGTSSQTGSDFFFALVKNLCGVLNTSGAWVTETLKICVFFGLMHFAIEING